MSLENPDTWLLVLRSVVLLTAFAGFAWALLAARRDNALNYARLAAQHVQTLSELNRITTQLNELDGQVRELSLPAPIVTPRPAPPPPVSIAPSAPAGARGYEMAIRMARNGASAEEIVASCGTTRAEARLLRRLHFAGGASAA